MNYSKRVSLPITYLHKHYYENNKPTTWITFKTNEIDVKRQVVDETIFFCKTINIFNYVNQITRLPNYNCSFHESLPKNCVRREGLMQCRKFLENDENVFYYLSHQNTHKSNQILLKINSPASMQELTPVRCFKESTNYPSFNNLRLKN